MKTYIDANNLLKRYYHGGEYPYTIWVASLRRALAQHGAENTIVVCDTATSRQYRRAICGKYKEGRDVESDPIFFQMFDDCINIALAFNCTVVKVHKGEADDYIHKFAESGDTVWSNDRDLWTLLAKNVSIYVQATTKVTDDMLWQKFKTRFPEEVLLYKALVGDPSDNIAGRRGFGPAAWEKLDQAGRDSVFKAFREGLEHQLISFEAGKSFELASPATDIEFEIAPLTNETFQEYITRKGIVC